MKSVYQRDIYSPLVIVAPFRITKYKINKGAYRCASDLNTMWYRCTTGYWSSIKKECVICVQIELKAFLLNLVSQTRNST